MSSELEQAQDSQGRSPFDRYVREFVAAQLGDITPDQVVGFRFVAEPGREWSEYTAESFACHMVITTDQMGQDHERHIYLSEHETCGFLNGYGSVTQHSDLPAAGGR